MFKKNKQTILFLFLLIAAVTLGLSLSSQKVSAYKFKTGETGFQVGDDPDDSPILLNADHQNLFYAVIDGASSTGHFIKLQRGIDNDKFKIDYNGKVTATSFVGDGTGLTGISGLSQWLNATGGIYYNSGKVGIGTTAPNYKLDLYASEGTATNLIVSNYFKDASPNGGSGIIRLGADGYNTDIEQNSSNNPLRFGTFMDTNIVNNYTASGGKFGNINFVTGNVGGSSVVMTIGGGTQKGNVGIGTTGPGTDLDIVKTKSGSGTGLRIWNQSNTADSSAVLDLSVAGTSAGDARIKVGVASGNSYAIGVDNSDGDKFKIAYDASGGATLGTGDMFTIQTDGNVGIGTTGPGYKLSVADIGATPMINIWNNSATSQWTGTRLSRGGTGDGAEKWFIGMNSSDAKLRFRRTGASDDLVIDEGGNVGIGRTIPEAKLDVDGDLKFSGGIIKSFANDLNVTTNMRKFNFIWMGPDKGLLDIAQTYLSQFAQTGSQLKAVISTGAVISTTYAGSAWIGNNDSITSGAQLLLSVGSSFPNGVYALYWPALEMTHRLAGSDNFDKVEISNIIIKEGSPSAGKILTAVDGTGLAAWQTPTTGGGEVIGDEILDAANATLTRSGAGTAADPYKLALNVNNANTWTALQTFSNGLTVSSSAFTLPNTSHSDAMGIIYKGTDRFIHNFNYGNNGTVTTLGGNTFVGINAGNLTMGSGATSNFHASKNSAVGDYTLYYNTTGYYNAAMGYAALYNNTTGLSNAAMGYAALYNNTTGLNNTAIGDSALYNNTTGYQNSAIGNAALSANTTGYNNTAIGNFAGKLLANGSSNQISNQSIFLGNDTKANAAGDSNEVVIGSSAIGQGSNSVVLGNDLITKTILKGNVGIGTTAPASKLDISDSSLWRALTVRSSGGTNAFVAGNNAGVVTIGAHVGTLDAWAPMRINWDGGSGGGDVTFKGNVGIGTVNPGAQLELSGAGNTKGLRFFVPGESDDARIYLENPETNVNNLVIASSDDGDQDQIIFRNVHWQQGNRDVMKIQRSQVLVDGNVKIGTVDSYLDFGSDTRQMINLWGDGPNAEYGIGIQSGTLYLRSNADFAFYQGGSHNDGNLNAGGGTPVMVIDDGKVGIGGSPYIDTDHKLTVRANNSFSAIYAIQDGTGNAIWTNGRINDMTVESDYFANTIVGKYAHTAPEGLTGQHATAIGYGALRMHGTGDNNTAVGYGALYFNSNGVGNTALGYNTLYYRGRGSYNTAIGYEALQGVNGYSWNNISQNTAVGYQALKNFNSDSSINDGNTAVGYQAGLNISSGTNNTAIGSRAFETGYHWYNSTAIGANSVITASNQIRLGNSSVTSIGGYAGWSNLSDGRFKKNVIENVPGLDFITKLHPVTFNWELDKLDSFLGSGDQIRDSKGEEKSKILQTGLIAQDVERAAKELNYDFSGVIKPKNEKDYYNLNYAEFTVPLIKAVQELDGYNKELEFKIKQLTNEMNDLRNNYETRLNRLEYLLK